MKQHKKQKLLKNYYNEPREEIEENIINYDNINDIGKKAIEFIKNDNEEDKIFIVKAACGTGKTLTIINEVLKHYQPNKHKVLHLTENLPFTSWGRWQGLCGGADCLNGCRSRRRTTCQLCSRVE